MLHSSENSSSLSQGTIEQDFGKGLSEKSIAQGTIEYLVIIGIVVLVKSCEFGLLYKFLF